MAVSRKGQGVVLLRMVRAERLGADAGLLARLREHFPDDELVWATTESGAKVLNGAISVPVLVLSSGGFSPGALREAVTYLRAAKPAACVVGYDAPTRRGNLLLEALAWASRAPRMWWTIDGGELRRLGRGLLGVRLLAGVVLATVHVLLGLLGGGLVAVLVPLLAGLCRQSRPAVSSHAT